MFAFSNLKTNRNQSAKITINDCIFRCNMKYLSKPYYKILMSFIESYLIKKCVWIPYRLYKFFFLPLFGEWLFSSSLFKENNMCPFFSIKFNFNQEVSMLKDLEHV